MNLLDNAIKYSGPCEPVEVGAQIVGDRVAFLVRDHGIGIPTRDLERIFERFYRVDRRAQPRHRRHRARSRHRSPRRAGARRRRHRRVARGRGILVHAPCAARERRRHASRPRGFVMADPPLILVVDDEQSYRDALSVALAARGLPRGDRGRRSRGDRALRRDPARARAARRDAAEDLGRRRVPRPPLTVAGSDHHGDRAELARSTPSSVSRSAPTTT